jgi:hypothetical protein
VALALGPVLIQDGDYYGPVVNLASRLVGVANPGTVLASDEFRLALESEHGAAAGDGDANGAGDGDANGDATGAGTGFDMRPLRTRNLKDIGRIQVWKLSRMGTEPGADRRRNMRWERLEGVLRELDDLRDRGEKAVSRGAMPAEPTDGAAVTDGAEPGSVAVETGSGDALGPELETPLERSDRTSP